MSRNLPYQHHVTVAGQTTMHQVAAVQYGNAALWPKISEANPRFDPYDLPAGTTLVIPAHSVEVLPAQRPRAAKRPRGRWAA